MAELYRICKQKVNSQLSTIKYSALLLSAYDDTDPAKERLVKPEQEIQKAQMKTIEAKKRIVGLVAEVGASCSGRKQYPQLGGEFGVMDVFCSKCSERRGLR